MKNWVSAWNVMSILVFMGQLALGTDPAFAGLSLMIFLATPRVFLAYWKIESLGAFIFLATYAKLFLVSQWIKLLLLQAADSNLQAPLDTVAVLLLGLLAFWMVALALPFLLRKRDCLIPPPQDPVGMKIVALGAVALTVGAILARHDLGFNRVGEADYQEGHGYALILFLDSLMPLAVAALTARAATLSGGRRFVDAWVLAALAASFLQGVWENQRTVMMAGAVCFAVTYVMYGGRVRGVHVVGIVLTAIIMQSFLFPLIEIQRGFSRNLTAMEYLSETVEVAGKLLDSRSRAGYDSELEETYQSWAGRLYYGAPTGFLDRFTPNQLDEAVAYTDMAGVFGGGYLPAQLSYAIPNLVLIPLGYERATRGIDMLDMALSGRIGDSNFGVLAEIYADIGMIPFFPVCVIVLAAYISLVHLVFGGIRRNYYAAFGFSALYFVFADSDLSNVISLIFGQGVLYLILMMVLVSLNRINLLRWI